MKKMMICLICSILCSSLWAIPTQGLAGYWQGDGTAQDTSIYGSHGTLVGDTVYDTGYFGQAFKFDGNEDYVRIGNPSQLNFTSAMSFSAWIKPLGAGSSPTWGGILINKENSYEIARNDAGYIIWAFNNPSPGWTWINTNIYTPLNVWSHITLTYQNGIVKTYLNGSLQHTYNGSGNLAIQNSEFWIGARQGGGQRFHGLMDEVAVYDVALDASQSIQLMTTTSVPEPCSWMLVLPVLACLLFQKYRK